MAWNPTDPSVLAPQNGPDGSPAAAPATARPQRIEPDALVRALAEHLRHWLPTHRWFGAVGEVPDSVVPLELEVLVEGWPTLVWCPVEVTQPSGSTRCYQLVLAMHRQASESAEPGALVGVVAAPAGTAHVYDALGDAAGALALAQVVAPDVRVEAPEPLHRRDGCTSAVLFDDRWQLTLYRHLDGLPQPDVDLPLAVAAAAPEVVARPRAVWQRDGADLAVLRRASTRSISSRMR